MNFPTESRPWQDDLYRRFRRQRRAMLLASGIAGCLAIVAILEAVLWAWR